MSRKIAPLLPMTDELLRQLGERLRLARLRRRLPAKQLAERAGMAPMTLRSVERGGSGVTIGAYSAVMQVLGIEKDLDLLAQSDPMGRSLQDARLSHPHRKTTARKHAPSALNPTKRTRAVIKKSSLLAESSAQEQLRQLFESLPTDQMRTALEALAGAQMHKALAARSSGQLRETPDVQSRATEKPRKPAADAREWFERSGFASSQALADLISAPAPLSRAKRR